ncbi:hypothetical protein [Nocardia australiensis]|uniref:hypothetical protein n=1 Tax=Nocardia australiensis TaxID=2887191 RepID=UPI001D144AD2|nr:hypothetical protein [Nocardia australiensis]
MKVDWTTYYEAAKKCHDLANDLRAADKPVHDAMKGGCAGMAGNAHGCKEWGLAFDKAALETAQTCTNLADALTNFGYVLYAAGYNLGISDQGKTSTRPERPTIQQVSQYKVDFPTSVGDNGSGIERDANGVEAIFNEVAKQIADAIGKLPNGDEDKLGKAKAVWETFGNHQTVQGAASTIGTILGMFDGADDTSNATYQKGIEGLRGHLETMRGGATQLAAASVPLAKPIGEYQTNTHDVRVDFESAIKTALIALTATLAVTAVTAWFTFGASVAAGGATAAVIGSETVTAVKTAYELSKLYSAFGWTGAFVAGAAVTIEAFNGVPDFNSIGAALAGIISIQTHINDDDGTDNGGSGNQKSGTAQTTEQKSAAVKDVVTDESGALIGTEDATGVQMVSQEQVDKARAELTEKLGPPRVQPTPKGDIEVWEISGDPKSTVTYRPFSQSGGATIDYNNVPGVSIKRWHIPK